MSSEGAKSGQKGGAAVEKTARKRQKKSEKVGRKGRKTAFFASDVLKKGRRGGGEKLPESGRGSGWFFGRKSALKSRAKKAK